MTGHEPTLPSIEGTIGLRGIAGSKVPVLNRPGGVVIGEATITADGKVVMHLDHESSVELRARLERNEFASISIGNAYGGAVLNDF